MTEAKPDANATPARSDSEAGSRRFCVLGVLRGTTLRNLWGALGLLAVGLGVTVLASHYIRAGVKSAAQREFDFACNEIRLNINARLEAAAQILRSGVALFDATETVSRGEWRTFTRRLKLDKYLPGIQGIGFALWIPREQLASHVQAIRGEGFPDYEVRPAGERNAYSAIIYLEPFERLNLRAFGFDMFSEPVRRAAMERARDEHTAALSGKVILVQETGEDVQAGVLMYVPFYRHGLPVETLEQRLDALQGWVYSPYRMTDLMRGTLRNWDVKQQDNPISLQVHDGDVLSADTLLYDSQGTTDGAPASSARMTRLIPVDYAGHRWTLRFTEPGGLASFSDYGNAWLVLFGGTMLTILLSGLMLWRQQRICFYRDKAEAGEALIASEERFRSYVDNAPDGVFITDDKGRYLEVNKAACKLTGYSKQEFEQLSILDLLPEESMETGPAQFRTAVETGMLTTDLGLRRKDGSTVYVALSAVRLSGMRILGFTRDITERKRLEGTLRQQQKLASMGTLARGMAHEINNPLMGIINYAELVKEQAAGNALLVEFAGEILAEGQRVARMTQSLLGFTQQRAEVAFETATLEDLLASVWPPVAASALEQGIALSCDIPEDLPPVSCRRGQVETVVTALLTNAMEAWGEGPAGDGERPAGDRRLQAGDGAGGPPPDGAAREKKIAIRAFMIADCQLPIGGDDGARCGPQSQIKNQKSKIRLTVEDNGPGIPKKIQERLFDPFFTTKDRTKHSGLGLWISRSIAQDHGGELTCESKTGHGAWFHMDIPVFQDS